MEYMFHVCKVLYLLSSSTYPLSDFFNLTSVSNNTSLHNCTAKYWSQISRGGGGGGKRMEFSFMDEYNCKRFAPMYLYFECKHLVIVEGRRK